MRTEDQLLALAHGSFLAGFRKLAQHSPGGAVRETAGVFAFVSGLPISLLNGCIVTEAVEHAEIDAALSWTEQHDVPYRLWIVDGLLGDLAARHRLDTHLAPYPGMVLHPIPEPPAPAKGVEVVALDDGDPNECVQIAVEGGMSRDVAERLYARSFAADPDVQLFVGRLDGKLVGSSTSIQGGGASGIVAVGTLPEARRRGVGTALSWAAVNSGRRHGFDTIVLQSSEMGFPVYTAMGFRTVVTYVGFASTRVG